MSERLITVAISVSVTLGILMLIGFLTYRAIERKQLQN